MAERRASLLVAVLIMGLLGACLLSTPPSLKSLLFWRVSLCSLPYACALPLRRRPALLAHWIAGAPSGWHRRERATGRRSVQGLQVLWSGVGHARHGAPAPLCLLPKFVPSFREWERAGQKRRKVWHQGWRWHTKRRQRL